MWWLYIHWLLGDLQNYHLAQSSRQMYAIFSVASGHAQTGTTSTDVTEKIDDAEDRCQGAVKEALHMY